MTTELKVLETRPNLIRKDVVDVLKTALAEAEAGNYVDVCVSYTTSDGRTGRQWSMTDSTSTMAGGLAITLQRYIENLR